MAGKGLDRATSIAVSDLKRLGINAVGRYLAVDADRDWRDMSKAEFEGYIRNGISVWFCGEKGTGSAAQRGSYQEGLLYGQYYRLCMDEYQIPAHPAVYLATDVPITPAQIPGAVEHYRGFRDGVAPYPAGCYGGKILLRAVRDQLGYKYLWGTNAYSWDYGVSIPVNVQQHGAEVLANTDWNDLVTEDYGQYPIVGEQPHLEDDMAVQDLYNDCVPVEHRANPKQASAQEYLSAVGQQAAYWTLRAKEEGQPLADQLNLGDLNKLIKEWTEGNATHDSKSDKLDQIHTATGAHV